MIRFLLAGTILSLAMSADAAEIKIGYLRDPESKTYLSLLQIPADKIEFKDWRFVTAQSNRTFDLLDLAKLEAYRRQYPFLADIRPGVLG